MALPSDWSYLLAQAFLDAAVSCGASCDRRFVSPVIPEGLPPNCECQLVAVVTEGWSRNRRPDEAPCGQLRIAEVTLVLDLCAPAAGPKEVPNPVDVTGAARAASILRWQMMAGLQDARARGLFCVRAEDDPWPAGATNCCGQVSPAPWRQTRRDWGSGRWETTWTWTEPN